MTFWSRSAASKPKLYVIGNDFNAFAPESHRKNVILWQLKNKVIWLNNLPSGAHKMSITFQMSLKY